MLDMLSLTEFLETDEYNTCQFLPPPNLPHLQTKMGEELFPVVFALLRILVLPPPLKSGFWILGEAGRGVFIVVLLIPFNCFQ